MSHQLPFPTTLPLPRPTPLRTSSGVLSRRVTEMSSRPCPPCPAAPRLTPRTLPGSGCVPVSRAKTPAPVIAPRPRAVVRLPVGGPVRVEKSRRVGCWGVGSGLGGGSGAGRGRQQVVCAEALRLRDIRMTVMAVEAKLRVEQARRRQLALSLAATSSAVALAPPARTPTNPTTISSLLPSSSSTSSSFSSASSGPDPRPDNLWRFDITWAKDTPEDVVSEYLRKMADGEGMREIEEEFYKVYPEGRCTYFR